MVAYNRLNTSTTTTATTTGGDYDIIDYQNFLSISRSSQYTSNIPLLIIEDFYQRIGPHALIRAIEATSAYCHQQGHNVGKVIFKHRDSFLDAVHVCGNRCTGGCFHGILLQLFTDLQSGNQSLSAGRLLTYAAALCNSHGINSAGINAMVCFHGMGHVILNVAKNDLLNALDGCNKLPSVPSALFECSSGVYMEWIHEHLNNKSSVALAHEALFRFPFYPCDAFEINPSACYKYIFIETGFLSLSNVSKSRQVCDSLIARPAHRLACIHGVGYRFSVLYYKAYKELFPVDLLCSYPIASEKKMCSYGALWWSGPWVSNQTLADSFCGPLRDRALSRLCRRHSSQEEAIREDPQFFLSHTSG